MRLKIDHDERGHCPGPNDEMRISAKADYAVRAALELAAAPDGEPVKGEQLAEAQEIPLQFLEHILLELKHARLVRAKRGARGGYWLARPAEEITLADVIRAVEGPLANIQDSAPGGRPTTRARPSTCATSGSRCARTCARCSRASPSPTSRAASCPEPIGALIADPDAWEVR